MIRAPDFQGAWRSVVLLLGLILLAGRIGADEFLKRTTSLPFERAYHGAAVLGDHLYVFGGHAFDPKTKKRDPAVSVAYAKIGADGKLGPWGETTPIDMPRNYIANTSLVLNDTVYIIGGSTRFLEGKRLNTAIWTRPKPDGTLMPWQVSKPFEGSGVSCSAAVSTAGYLHLMGGLDVNNVTTNAVWSVRLFADGSLGEWQKAPALPIPLWFLHSGVVAGRVYVWGGLTGKKEAGSKPSDRVFSAPISGAGQIGAWREESQKLPAAFYGAPSATAGPYLMSFCPRYEGSKESTDIWWSTVTPQGLTPWQKRTTDIPMKIYHAVASDYRRGTIYIPGGQKTRTAHGITDVFMFQMNTKVREMAERAWASAEAAHSNSVAMLKTGSATPKLSFNADTRGLLPGFRTLTEARRASEGPNARPLVIYFNQSGAESCAEQLKVLSRKDAGKVLDAAACAWVNVDEYPQLAQQVGVYRVPAWIVYDRNGNEAKRLVGVQSLGSLGAALASAASSPLK